MRIYATATDHFNYHVYDVEIPLYYNFDIPPEVSDGFFSEPLYFESDIAATGKARLPIEKLVQLRLTNTPFSIINDKDVLYIFHSIDNYLLEVAPFIKSDESIKKYVKSVLLLRTDCYRLFCRCLNKHPLWKEKYLGNSPMVNKISRLYRSLDLKFDKFDSIEALRKPPYDVDGDISLPENIEMIYNV